MRIQKAEAVILFVLQASMNSPFCGMKIIVARENDKRRSPIDLDEVVIPDSVEKIDDCAFRGCVNLEKVVIPRSVTELGWGLFDGCENTVTVYCEEGSLVQEYCVKNGIKEARIVEKDID